MKLIFLVLLFIIIWQSPNARQFTSDGLRSASELISPSDKEMSIGETLDSFLDSIGQ